MAGTTTPDAIRAVNGSTLLDPAIQPFADAANCIMGNIDACAVSKGITSACLDTAAAWLGAHLMTMSAVGAKTATVKKETFENYSVERVVGGFSGKGVQSTTYGQTANTLSGGCLQEADKAPALVCFFG